MEAFAIVLLLVVALAVGVYIAAWLSGRKVDPVSHERRVYRELAWREAVWAVARLRNEVEERCPTSPERNAGVHDVAVELQKRVNAGD